MLSLILVIIFGVIMISYIIANECYKSDYRRLIKDDISLLEYDIITKVQDRYEFAIEVTDKIKANQDTAVECWIEVIDRHTKLCEYLKVELNKPAKVVIKDTKSKYVKIKKGK